MATLVPSQPADRSGPGLRGEATAFREPQVWLSLAVTVLGFGGMFGAFTYIAYTLTEVSGFAASTVPWLLILFGTGLFAGNYARRPGGRPVRAPDPVRRAGRAGPRHGGVRC